MTIPSLPLQLEGLRLKGNREYLQGADILSFALYALSGGHSLSEIHDIDIVFHALSHTGLTLRSDVPTGQESKAQLSCSIDGQRHKLFLVEDGRRVVERHPYPEEQIVAATFVDIDSLTAMSKITLPFTNIERWIAMIKALHHAAFPKANGKWLFTRARLASYPDSLEESVEHRVTIRSNFGGILTRSALSVDGHNLGDIFFALT